MASVQQLKSRIRSVNSTKQITKAMQLVAASKMRRATAAVKETTDYATAARELLVDLAHDREAVASIGHDKSSFAYSGKICATVHVWFWRSRDGVNQLLLQRRSLQKDEFPGLWDVSAAGHINLGESPVEAAVRETHEEIGLKISPENLTFVMTLPVKFDNPKYDTFRFVYLYNLEEDVEFKFNDAEVDAVEWKNIDDLNQMEKAGTLKRKEPEYWQILFGRLDKVSWKEEDV